MPRLLLHRQAVYHYATENRAGIRARKSLSIHYIASPQIMPAPVRPALISKNLTREICRGYVAGYSCKLYHAVIALVTPERRDTLGAYPEHRSTSILKVVTRRTDISHSPDPLGLAARLPPRLPTWLHAR